VRLFALFVGIDTYADPRIRTLRFAKADAVRFKQLIEEHIDESERCTFLLTDRDATRSEILKKLGVEIATQATQQDIILVHFAGHGSPEIGERVDEANRYLVPYDAEYSNIFGTCIDMHRDLTSVLERLRAHFIVVLIDTCFSGMAGGRTFEGPNLNRLKTKFRPLISLQTMDLGEGRVIISASDDDEVAFEDEKLGHGIFSAALFDALTDPAIPDTSITLTKLYDITAAKTQLMSNGRQTPVLNGRSKLGRLPRFVESTA
jgi:uncharacterized caspase-like protein